MAAAPRRGGEWIHQDGQHIARAREDMTGRSHVQYQWDNRVAEVNEEYVGHPVRVAWREAEYYDHNPRTGRVRRRHEVGMIIVSRWACLRTAYIDPNLEATDE